jgi:hypothetical protein
VQWNLRASPLLYNSPPLSLVHLLMHWIARIFAELHPHHRHPRPPSLQSPLAVATGCFRRRQPHPRLHREAPHVVHYYIAVADHQSNAAVDSWAATSPELTSLETLGEPICFHPLDLNLMIQIESLTEPVWDNLIRPDLFKSNDRNCRSGRTGTNQLKHDKCRLPI